MVKNIDDTPQAVGRKGGKTTLKKHGKKHYQEMGKKRWSKKNASSKTISN